ncbi:MAG: carboxylesterase family protein [Chitinophagales bacterium]|nr:carboxylesterase family protein [Chitinophagales bacterium]
MKQLIWFIVIFSVIVSTTNAQCLNGRYSAKIFDQVNTYKGIKYQTAPLANGAMLNQYLDVYEPRYDTLSVRPLIIFFHGGAFWTGTKDYQSNQEMGKEFAQRGYVYSTVNYRLESSPLSLLNSDLMIKAVGRGIQDTKTAIKFFFESARNEGNPYKIDTNNIFLAGSSAGSFNVLHTIFLDEADTLPSDWSNNLNEIGGIFGDYNFIDFPSKIKGLVNINGALGDVDFMNNQHFPFLSIHNTLDPEVPFNSGKPYNIPFLPTVDGSNILHQRANELGMYNPFYIIPTKDHTSFEMDFFGFVVQPYFDSTIWYMNNYFNYMLCGTPTAIQQQTIKSVAVYPNPTSDMIYFDNIPYHALNIIDMNGKQVYQQNYYTSTLNTNQIHLANNHYLIVFYDDKFVATHLTNFIKQ